MRLHFGPVPRTPDFDPKREGWTPVPEPSQETFLSLAILLSLPLFFFWFWVWGWLNGVREITLGVSFGQGRGTWPFVLGLLLVGLPGFTLIHELLHAVWFPGGLRSDDTVIGFRLFFACAHTFRPFSKSRAVLIAVTPLLVLTVLPILIDALIPHWNMPTLLLLLVLANGAGCSGDLLALFLWARLPSGALIRNQGWKSWYRLPVSAGEKTPEAPRHP